MLYLAEVKKQIRGFIGGSRTELKLLACQHNDQTWSSVPGEESVSTEEIEQTGEGALVLLNLGNNRQIQGKPELAGAELVRQLQRLSRLSEKFKTQQEEIEQWKESLTYQSQELARRETEWEARIEQLEQGGGSYGESLPEGQSLEQPLQAALSAISVQQEILNDFWQQFEDLKSQTAQKQQEVQQQEEMLKTCFQELETSRSSLEQGRIQREVQQTTLNSKQQLLRKINLNLQKTQEIQDAIRLIVSGGGDAQLDARVDLGALESMPLGELEAAVNNLQADLDKLVRFVNDQEEELTLQCQAVQELQEKLISASEYDRMAIENDFAEEQERKQFLDQTLVGQRRTLRERQDILLQHLRVLRRRQGIMELDNNTSTVDLEPVSLQLEKFRNSTEQERQILETEIEHGQPNLQKTQAMIEQLETEQAHKTQTLKTQEEACQQSQRQLAQLQTRLSFYEQALQPLQNQLDEARQQLEILEQCFSPS